MILELKIFPAPILQGKCGKVTEFSNALITLVEHMKETLYTLPGLALAAPQVGFHQRIIALNMMKIEGKQKTLILINPSIKKTCGSVTMEEGCLSVPEIFDDIVRPERIEVMGMGINKEEVAFEADGLLARVLQHEIDHLDGILFWDHLPEKKRDKLKNKYLKSCSAKAASV